MSFTAVDARNAKPRETPYKLGAGRGLFLLVTPRGGRYWRLKYHFAGKEKLLSLGVFPEVSLAEARAQTDKLRALLRDGKDPAAARRATAAAHKSSAVSTFESVGTEWLKKQSHLAPATFEKAKWTLEKLAFPWLGHRPIAEITAYEVLETLRRVESRGKLETAQRLQQRCSQVFRYAIVTGRAQRDPCTDVRGALATPKTRHRAAITDPVGIGALLRAIDGYAGNFLTVCALKLSALVFLRPGEIRRAEWAEIDLGAAEWRISAEKMKMRAEHIVPLSRQAVALFEEVKPLTGKHRYVFPSLRSPNECMSEATVIAGIRRLGYSGQQMTAHGFRAMASTRLNELGWPPDVIERQLAHVERNKVRAAYNRAQHLPERRKMMQAWADYLDGLRGLSGPT